MVQLLSIYKSGYVCDTFKNCIPMTSADCFVNVFHVSYNMCSCVHRDIYEYFFTHLGKTQKVLV